MTGTHQHPEDKKEAVTIEVPAKDPVKPDPKKAKNVKKSDEGELTEEARKKKADIDLLVERLQDPSEDVAQLALRTLSTELREGTSSMVSVPLPLKFLRPHFEALETFYNNLPETSTLKKPMADVLSVLATTVTSSEAQLRRALRYSLAGTREGLTTWGPEYLRNITREIIAEYEARQESYLASATADRSPGLDLTDLLALVMEIVPFYIKHHNEIDAVDLLAEVQLLRAIVELVDARNYKRITQYLMSLANYAVSDQDVTTILTVTYEIFKKMNEPCECIRVALKLGDSELVLSTLDWYKEDALVRSQMGYILGQHRWSVPGAQGENLSGLVGENVANGIANEFLTGMYKLLAKELDVEEAKLPEDVYKSHLEEKRRTAMPLDSAKQNLASTLVNAFVNAGFCRDGLMTVDDGAWLYKNKEYGMTSAVASLGALMLWDVEAGFGHLDKYHWSPDPIISSGAFMGFGLVCAGVQNECDPAFAILVEQLESGSCTTEQTIGGMLGLAFAYIGLPRESFLDFLVPEIIDANISVDVSALAALTLGLSFLGTGNETVAGAILQALLERQFFSGNLDAPLAYFFALALGLLFLGQKEACDATLVALDAVADHPIGRFAKECVTGCAYAGTGDVTKVQYFLRLCGATAESTENNAENVSENAKDNDSAKATAGTDDGELSISSSSQPNGGLPLTTPVSGGANGPTGTANRTSHTARTATASGQGQPSAHTATSTGSNLAGMEQSVALMSMALIALGEDIGSAMILRMVDHLLQYGSLAVRRGVPLCLALLSPSAPKPAVVEVLSKLTHDPEPDVALNAIFSLGVVGAGTNNSRIAELLRQLATYYSKSANALFLVRIAQGLLYMGKGLMTLSPLHSDGLLIRPASLASLLVVIYSALFMKNTILGRYPYLLFFLIAGSTPRMLITVDTELQMLPVSVRVGQKIDVSGVAGNPRTITGFQTHTTPVLLAEGERAELATNDYITVASLPLEGIVILKPATSSNDSANS